MRTIRTFIVVSAIFAMMGLTLTSFGQGLPPANSIGTAVNNPLPTVYNLSATPAASYCAGGSVILSIDDSDAGINYPLRKNGSVTITEPGTGISIPYPGQTAGVYTMIAVNATTGCTATMNGTITVTENPLPVITAQPANKEVCQGGTTSFSITATGTGLTYQWYENKNDGMGFVAMTNTGVYSGVTSTTCVIAGATLAMNNYQYYCIVTNTTSCTQTSTIAVLVVDPLPTITAQPASTPACVGTNATFTVTATIPAGTISYQWAQSTNGGTSFTNIGGATNSSLTLTGVTIGMNNYQYRCTLTSSVGSCPITTTAAVLTVNPLPNAYAVTSSALEYCAGGNVTISVASSDLGNNYELYKNAAATGSIQPGVTPPAALSWGSQTFGTYTVWATNTTTGCTRQMNNSVTVVENANPTIASYVTTDVCDDLMMPAIISGITGVAPYKIEIFEYNSGVPSVGSLLYTQTGVTTNNITVSFNPTHTGTFESCVKITDAKNCKSW